MLSRQRPDRSAQRYKSLPLGGILRMLVAVWIALSTYLHRENARWTATANFPDFRRFD